MSCHKETQEKLRKMEIEEETSSPSRQFELSPNQEIIEIPGFVLDNLFTLKTMTGDIPVEEGVAIPLVDFVTKPILQWIISAYTIAHIEPKPITKFDQLYKHVEAYSRLTHILNPLAPPLLTLFGIGAIPTVEDLPLLFDLIRVLNWLDAEVMLLLSLVKLYQILSTLSFEEIETLFTTKKRKLEIAEQAEEDDKGLPFTPFYRREKLISDFLSQELPHELVCAPLALQKYITPFNGTESYTLFLKVDGLYEHWVDYNQNQHRKADIPGTPLFIASGYEHSLCLTSTGLYGRGSNSNGQLGLGRRLQTREWVKIDIDGEVLLISAGSYFTLVLTTTGLYATGKHDDGQLGLGVDSDGERQDYKFFTRIEAIDGEIRHIEAGDEITFVLTTTGLYACGANGENELSIDPTKSSIDLLSPVLNITGAVLSIAAGYEMSAVVTSDGLYVTGEANYGKLGLTEPGSGTVGFTKVDTLTAKPLHVFCGYHYTVVWTEDGLYATGLNKYGQLATGDNLNKNSFTKMLGLEGEIQSVFADTYAVFVLTSKGVYQSGIDQEIGYNVSIEVDETIEQPLLFVFRLLNLEMGYSFLLTLSITGDDEEPQRKKQRLKCMKCQGKAQFIASRMQNLAVCSKKCLLSHKFAL